MPVHPYINYPGTCRQALELYSRAFGSQPFIMTRGEGPEDPAHPMAHAVRNQVMHGTMTIHGTVVMFADAPPGSPRPSGNNITLMITAMAPEEIDAAFAILSEGGRVLMEPKETFWSERYALLTDHYGINWQLSAETA